MATVWSSKPKRSYRESGTVGTDASAGTEWTSKSKAQPCAYVT